MTARQGEGTGTSLRVLAGVLGLWLLAQPAGAQDKRDAAAARELFQQGVTAADAEDWATAADRFERSLALHPSEVVSYNLATAWMEVGRLVEASEMFEGLLKNPDTKPELRKHARAQQELVMPRIARLTVQFEPEPGDEIRLGERSLPPAVLGVAVPVDPGSRVLTVKRGGVLRFERALQLAEGSEQTLRVELEPEPGAPAAVVPPTPAEVATAAAIDTAPEPAPEPASQRDGGGVWRSPWFWTGVGAVVVAAVVIAVVAAGGSDTVEPGHMGTLDPGTLEVPR